MEKLLYIKQEVSFFRRDENSVNWLIFKAHNVHKRKANGRLRFKS